ncbi:MAG TPA: DNA polymerase I [Kofleriaceae bacterium]|nr:DNA polymerase I [Kofleriaceae bacterium]
MQRLHILDGYGYIFRAFYGLAGPDGRGVRLTTSGGMPTGALYVYARMLIRLYKDVRPERIAVVFDAPGPTFRDQIDEGYKATRRETPDDLQAQMKYFRPLTEAFCWPVLSIAGVEADDVIATLVRQAREAGWDVVIHSADKDLMQLIGDHVEVVDALRQITYDEARVIEKFGVPPAKVGEWLALVGDTSDNIPGVAGIGKVTAAKLLTEFGSIDGLLASVDQLKGKQKERFTDPEQLERLARSRELVTLKTDVDVGASLEELVPAPWDGTRLRELFEELEFQALLASMDAGAAAGSSPGRVEAQAGPAPITVTAIPALTPVLDAAREHGVLAVQVDTDGQRPDRARVVGLSLAAPGVAPAYVPVAHRYLSAPPQLAAEQLSAALAETLANPQVGIMCHDVKAARRALRSLGLALDRVKVDTMLAAYLLDASSELENVAARFGATALRPRKEVLGKGKTALEPEHVTVEEASAWSGAAAAAVLRAGIELEAQLARAGQLELLRDLEQPLALMLADLEDRGIKIDVDHLGHLGDQLAADLAEIERRVFELAGEHINLGSPKQLAALLFERLGLSSDKMKKKKTGYSTDFEVLDSLRDQHPIVAPILEHRELTKLKGTYIDALPPLINPASGRLHTSFNQAVAATGRLSSQDPNLQNIPIRTELGREIRRAFIASEGKVLLSADYSQIELRILAHLSQDPVLVRAFRADIDVHTQTAAEVFGIPLEEVGSHERRVAKAVNYGLAYGQSDFGLSRALDIPRAEARFYIETYFQRFARVRAFMDELVEVARRIGFATTLLGRRRPIPDLGSRNYQRRSAAERIAQNTPMQGSGADIMKLAMLRVDELLRASDFEAAMLLTVHDELVFEVAADRAEALGAEIKRVMEGVYALDVPLRVDLGTSPNWAGAH